MGGVGGGGGGGGGGGWGGGGGGGGAASGTTTRDRRPHVDNSFITQHYVRNNYSYSLLMRATTGRALPVRVVGQLLSSIVHSPRSGRTAKARCSHPDRTSWRCRAAARTSRASGPDGSQTAEARRQGPHTRRRREHRPGNRARNSAASRAHRNLPGRADRSMLAACRRMNMPKQLPQQRRPLHARSRRHHRHRTCAWCGISTEPIRAAAREDPLRQGAEPPVSRAPAGKAPPGNHDRGPGPQSRCAGRWGMREERGRTAPSSGPITATSKRPSGPERSALCRIFISLRGQAGDQSRGADRRGACRLLHHGAVADLGEGQMTLSTLLSPPTVAITAVHLTLKAKVPGEEFSAVSAGVSNSKFRSLRLKVYPSCRRKSGFAGRRANPRRRPVAASRRVPG